MNNIINETVYQVSTFQEFTGFMYNMKLGFTLWSYLYIISFPDYEIHLKDFFKNETKLRQNLQEHFPDDFINPLLDASINILEVSICASIYSTDFIHSHNIFQCVFI